MDKRNPIVEKIKFLFNDPVKKFAAIAILFSAILALHDVNLFLRKIPTYEQLNTSIGEIRIDLPALRVGRIFNLIINKQKIPFSCSFDESSDRACLSNTMTLKYQGKVGKVWWFKGNNIGWEETPRLYQLEVDGKLIISYQQQVEKHGYEKKSYFYSWITLLFLLIIWFAKYFSNESKNNRGNTK